MSNKKLIFQTLLSFDLPFGIDLPNSQYEICTKYGNVIAELKQIMRKNDKIEIPKIIDGSINAIHGDRWGLLFTTNVRIHLKHLIPVPPEKSLKMELELTDNLPVIVVNRIVDVCRVVLNEKYSKISNADIFSLSCRHLDEQGNDVPGLALRMAGGGQIMTVGQTNKIDNEKITTIKNYLKNRVQLSIQVVLLANAEYHLFFGEYRLAVIEAETSFEIFVDEYIRRGYKKMNKTPKEIEKILEKWTTQLLKSDIEKISGHKFYPSKEYDEWHTKAYDIRTKIVHWGKDVTREQAKDAIQVINKTINFFMCLQYNS